MKYKGTLNNSCLAGCEHDFEKLPMNSRLFPNKS